MHAEVTITVTLYQGQIHSSAGLKAPKVATHKTMLTYVQVTSKNSNVVVNVNLRGYTPKYEHCHSVLI